MSLSRSLNRAGVCACVGSHPGNDGNTALSVTLHEGPPSESSLYESQQNAETFNIQTFLAEVKGQSDSVCAKYGVVERYMHVNPNGQIMLQVFAAGRAETAVWLFGWGNGRWYSS